MVKNIRILLLNNSHLLRMLLDEKEDSDLSWKEFLRRFSKLILKVIWQLEKDKDEYSTHRLNVCGIKHKKSLTSAITNRGSNKIISQHK